MRIGFIGVGRVASVLAPAFQQHGHAVTAVASRTSASAKRLATMLGPRPQVCTSPQAVAERCDLVFLTTPDDAIEQVAGAIRWRKGQAAVHTSGALSVDVLATARGAGAGVASFHPLQTFAGEQADLDGVTIAIEAEGPLGETLEGLATDLGCLPFRISAAHKALYHACGVMASNYVVALVGAAARLLEQQGLPRQRALEALLPLVKQTVHNIEERGIAGSLTGPIARGDAGTVARHLHELTQHAPELLEAYRELGLLALPVAAERGQIEKKQEQRLERLLAAYPFDAAQEVRR